MQSGLVRLVDWQYKIDILILANNLHGGRVGYVQCRYVWPQTWMCFFCCFGQKQGRDNCTFSVLYRTRFMESGPHTPTQFLWEYSRPQLGKQQTNQLTCGDHFLQVFSSYLCFFTYKRVISQYTCRLKSHLISNKHIVVFLNALKIQQKKKCPQNCTDVSLP